MEAHCSYRFEYCNRRNHEQLAMACLSIWLLSTSSVSSLPTARSTPHMKPPATATSLHGWLDSLLPRPPNPESESESDDTRRLEYPEQYPATYELQSAPLPADAHCPPSQLVRPLLRSTQLQSRPLQIAYDASLHGWDAPSFHARVDGRGAAVVVAATQRGEAVGGYNPKGWASTGGARPSVAAFLFVRGGDGGGWRKLRKVGGGGMACAMDDPGCGIAFGPDGFVVGLQSGEERVARSKLGTYYERADDGRDSLFRGGGTALLTDLKVLVGGYEDGEDIPYSGAVLDMTSG